MAACLRPAPTPPPKAAAPGIMLTLALRAPAAVWQDDSGDDGRGGEVACSSSEWLEDSRPERRDCMRLRLCGTLPGGLLGLLGLLRLCCVPDGLGLFGLLKLWCPAAACAGIRLPPTWMLPLLGVSHLWDAASSSETRLARRLPKPGVAPAGEAGEDEAVAIMPLLPDGRSRGRLPLLKEVFRERLR